MHMEPAIVVVSGNRLWKRLNRRKKGKESLIELWGKFNIKVEESSSTLAAAAKAMSGACLIITDLSGRVSGGIFWDVGFVYGAGRRDIVIGLCGLSRHPGKIADAIACELGDLRFFMKMVEEPKFWEGLGKSIQHRWNCSKGKLEIATELMKEVIDILKSLYGRSMQYPG